MERAVYLKKIHLVEKFLLIKQRNGARCSCSRGNEQETDLLSKVLAAADRAPDRDNHRSFDVDPVTLVRS
jgi:hypothetical protein